MSRCIFPIENGGVFSSQSLFVFRHSTLFSHHHGFKGKIYLLNGRKLIPNIWRYRHLFSTKKHDCWQEDYSFQFFWCDKKGRKSWNEEVSSRVLGEKGKKAHRLCFLQQRQVTTSLWSRWDCENSNLNRRSCSVDRWWICYVFNLLFGIYRAPVFSRLMIDVFGTLWFHHQSLSALSEMTGVSANTQVSGAWFPKSLL